MKRILALTLLIALLCTLLPVGGVAAGDDNVTINILEFTDTHGKIGTAKDPIGARMAVMIESIRKNDRDGTLLLGGGDFYTGSDTDLSNIYHGRPVQDWMKLVGTDATIVGNHEFDWDYREVVGFTDESGIPLLCCNLFTANGTPMFEKGSVILTKRGVRILIVGAMCEVPYRLKGVDVLADPTVCVKREIDRYDPSEYDIIIPVVHGDGIPTVSLAKLADEGYPVACVFGGHSHADSIIDYYTPKGAHVPYYVAGAYNKVLASVKLLYNKATKEVTLTAADPNADLLTLETSAPSSSSPYYKQYQAVVQMLQEWESGKRTIHSYPDKDIPFHGDDEPNEPEARTGECGPQLTWAFDDTTGCLTISGTGPMNDYPVRGTAPWFGLPIQSVNVEDGVTSVGIGSFTDVRRLLSVTLSSTVTEIGAYAFLGCDNLAETDLGSGLISIGRYAFYGCRSLDKVKLPESLVTLEEGAFRGCTGLCDLNAPDSLRRIGCNVLENTELRAWLPVENGATYFGSHLLKYDHIRSSCTVADGTLTIADGVFLEDELGQGCLPLESLTLPRSLVAIGEAAVRGCSELKRVTLPDSVEQVSDFAFYCCSKLAALKIGSGLRSVGQYGFFFCDALRKTGELDISNLRGWCEMQFANQFSNPTYYARQLRINGKPLTDVTLPNGLETINPYCFYLCESLTSVTVPDTVKNIGAFAFFNCSALTNVNIPEGVPAIRQNTFSFCYQLSGIVLPESLKTVEQEAFSTCSRLRYVIFSGDLPAINKTAFKDSAPNTTCGVYYPVTEAWKNYDRRIDGNLNWLPLEGNVGPNIRYRIDPAHARLILTGTGIMPSITGFNPWMIVSLKGYLKEVSFDRTIGSAVSWGFTSMVNLERVVFPKNITLVGSEAFLGCTGLKAVYVLNDSCYFPSEGTQTLGIPGTAVIYGHRGSTAETYAKSHGYTFRALSGCGTDGHLYAYQGPTKPTCEKEGSTNFVCDVCGTVKKEPVPMLAHTYANGYCLTCGRPEFGEDPCLRFTDLSRTAWYHAAVDYVIANELMDGTKQTEFAPKNPMTRAMLVTVLWRFEGRPEEGENRFEDVAEGRWFTQAIAWASDRGIVDGVKPTLFAPNNHITREQMTTILFRYAEKKDITLTADGDLSQFPDAGKIGKYAQTAMQWAVGDGIISGMKVNGVNSLNPKGEANRAQVATILMRFIETYMK